MRREGFRSPSTPPSLRSHSAPQLFTLDPVDFVGRGAGGPYPGTSSRSGAQSLPSCQPHPFPPPRWPGKGPPSPLHTPNPPPINDGYGWRSAAVSATKARQAGLGKLGAGAEEARPSRRRCRSRTVPRRTVGGP